MESLDSAQPKYSWIPHFGGFLQSGFDGQLVFGGLKLETLVLLGLFIIATFFMFVFTRGRIDRYVENRDSEISGLADSVKNRLHELKTRGNSAFNSLSPPVKSEVEEIGDFVGEQFNTAMLSAGLIDITKFIYFVETRCVENNGTQIKWFFGFLNLVLVGLLFLLASFTFNVEWYGWALMGLSFFAIYYCVAVFREKSRDFEKLSSVEGDDAAAEIPEAEHVFKTGSEVISKLIKGFHDMMKKQ